ncbi:MAG TPA: nuclear transport factor 2 family protein [Acidimicrobiales bacterium]|nr:nuclear transport factor 2 family protein [Acidimicrobiales bacterium]
MTVEERVALVRSGYERLNDQDLEGLLALFTDDIEWPDAVNGSVLQGIEEVRAYFTRVFEITKVSVLVGDVFEIGDALVATTFQHFYDLDGRPVGEPRVVVNRFTFRGDRVSAMALTSHGEIPEEVRNRFPEG